MSLLLIGAGRFALPEGETPLGGRGCVVTPLAEFSPFAVLTVARGQAAVQRIPDSPVVLTVDGTRLGATALPLRHGARLDVTDPAGHRTLSGMIYGDARLVDAATEPVAGVPDEALAGLGELPGEPTAETGGRLVVLATGAVVDVPASGLVVGRAPESHLVLAGAEVSRRHAVIRPSLQGYILTDTSANGVWINRQRVDGGAQLLCQRDLIRIGDWELRFEADATTLEPEPPAAAGAAGGGPAPAAGGDVGGSAASSPVVAKLEVTAGGQRGAVFTLTRPVAHLGRDARSDVRLTDPSVSGAHATLQRRGGAWYVRDHGSTHGTHVGAVRVRGEQQVPPDAVLRLGAVMLRLVYGERGDGER